MLLLLSMTLIVDQVRVESGFLTVEELTQMGTQYRAIAEIEIATAKELPVGALKLERLNIAEKLARMVVLCENKIKTLGSGEEFFDLAAGQDLTELNELLARLEEKVVPEEFDTIVV